MTLEDILKAVSEVTGVSIEAMEGASKKREIADARHAFIQISKDNEFKVVDIGAAINKSHSSVCCSKRRDEDLIKKVNGILFPNEQIADEEKPKQQKTGFEIVDVSSRYFGPCYMILKGGDPSSHKDTLVDAVSEITSMEVRQDE